MKRLIQIIAFLVSIMAASQAVAAGGFCPQSANKLEDFARCMAPLPNGMGTRYVGTLANLDDDHIELMNALHTQPIVPPQVIPSSPYYYPTFNPMYSMMGALTIAYPSRAPAIWWMMRAGYPLY